MEERKEVTANDDQELIPLGIVSELGELGPGAIVSEQALARLFKRHPVSIKRAVARGELPPPTRLLGGPVWTVGAIIRHMEKRLQTVAKEAEKKEQKMKQLMP